MARFEAVQQLHATNVSVNIGEAMEARIKDPLWFLARQWQTGEFAAENGGTPGTVSLSWWDRPLTSATIRGESVPLDLDDPLEMAVEREGESGVAPAWEAAALEYTFDVRAGPHRFAAREYGGLELDWYHFDHDLVGAGAPPERQVRRMIPTQVQVRGAPHPRWWRFESAEDHFDSPVDPEPNALSTLLPEFLYIDVNNWYVVPLPARAGCVREIDEVLVADSFGVVTELGPAGGAGEGAWRVFAVDSLSETAAVGLDGRFLLMPHVALEVLDNDDVEEVLFFRDEESNLVWATERRYEAEDGSSVVNGERPVGTLAAGDEDVNSPDSATIGPRFRLISKTEPHWIPYVPRRQRPQAVEDGSIYLRRGRTIEAASRTNPQYGSRIVGETWRLWEEVVPPSGLRVRRIQRFARSSGGKGRFWIGRSREAGRRTGQPNLRFDYLEDDATG